MGPIRYKYLVKNLPLSVSRKTLMSHFTKFGEIHSAEVYFDKNTGFSKGYGMVAYTRFLRLDEMDQVHKIHGEVVDVTLVPLDKNLSNSSEE